MKKTTKTPTGISLDDLSNTILGVNPNIEVGDAKEIADEIRSKLVNSVVGSIGGRKAMSVRRRAPTKKKVETSKADKPSSGSKSIESELREVKRSTKKIENTVQTIQKNVSNNQKTINQIGKKVDHVFERVSVSDRTIGNKKYRFDPLGPAGMQIQSASEKGGFKSTYNRMQTIAAQDRAESIANERLSNKDAESEVKNVKKQLGGKKGKDASLSIAKDSGRPEAEQIQAEQSRKEYEMQEFEQNIDKKLDEIIDLLHGEKKSAFGNLMKDIAEIGAVAASLRLLGKVLPGGAAAAQATRRVVGMGGKAGVIGGVGRAALGLGAAEVAGSFMNRAGGRALRPGRRRVRLPQGTPRATLDRMTNTWVTSTGAKATEAEIAAAKGLGGAGVGTQLTKEEIKSLKNANIVQDKTTGAFKDRISGAPLSHEEASALAKDPAKLKQIRSNKSMMLRRAAGRGASTILGGAAKAAGGIGIFSALVETAGYVFGEKEVNKKNLISSAGGVGGAVAGGVAGETAGAFIGGAIGALFGGVGAIPGAFIGGMIGGIAGGTAGEYLGRSGAERLTEDNAGKLKSLQEANGANEKAKPGEFGFPSAAKDSSGQNIIPTSTPSPPPPGEFGFPSAAKDSSGQNIIPTSTPSPPPPSVGQLPPGKGGNGSTSEAMQFFTSKGWTKEQAAGIIGNLQQESGGNLQINSENKSENAYGIAQWRKPRQDIFKQVYGKDIRDSDFKEQLEFINYELSSTEARAGNLLKTARTAEEAASIFDHYYERSRETERGARIANALALIQGGDSSTRLAASPTSGQISEKNVSMSANKPSGATHTPREYSPSNDVAAAASPPVVVINNNNSAPQQRQPPASASVVARNPDQSMMLHIAGIHDNPIAQLSTIGRG